MPAIYCPYNKINHSIIKIYIFVLKSIFISQSHIRPVVYSELGSPNIDHSSFLKVLALKLEYSIKSKTFEMTDMKTKIFKTKIKKRLEIMKCKQSNSLKKIIV